MDQKKIQELIENAKEASKKAYAPYSKFQVGAVVLDDKGNTFDGCNVENMSYPVGVCAEKTAVSKGVSETGADFKITAVAVYTDTDHLTTPCGNCRQFISEFAQPNTQIICAYKFDYELISFNELFPYQLKIDGLK